MNTDYQRFRDKTWVVCEPLTPFLDGDGVAKKNKPSLKVQSRQKETDFSKIQSLLNLRESNP